MKNGIEHSIPVSASFNVFNYINLSPSFNYNEKWFFKKVEYEWNPMTNKVDTMANEYGFYRLYNYSMSVSASTTVYGMYDFTKKKRDRKIQAIRHVLTPSIGFSYTPDFGDFKYGYYKSLQRDSLGTTQTYSPYAQNAYSVPSSGRNMSMNFSLSQNLEMKVLSKRDTSGVKKIKLIDELRISGSYNFLADSMRLSTIPISFRTTLFGNFGINLSATLDPYRLTPDGKRINKLFFPGRIVSTGWSFGYTFKSRDDRSQTAINDITSIPPEYMNPFYDPYGTMDPVLRRQYMAQTYYDFSLPWNFGFNYTVNYSITTGNYPPKGYKKNVTQTVGFNGSLNLTPKMGITFQGGYDIKANRLTTSSVSITRDLHCWQMSFSWIPFGTYRSWSFNIGVKAASLSDLKYDKSQSMYETCTDTPRASSRPSIPHTPVSERTPVSACPSRHVRFARHRFTRPVSGRLPLSARYPYLFVYTDNDRPSPGCLNNPNNPDGLLPGHQRLRLVRNRAGAGPDFRHFTQRTADAGMPAASATYIRPTPARKQPLPQRTTTLPGPRRQPSQATY